MTILRKSIYSFFKAGILTSLIAPTIAYAEQTVSAQASGQSNMLLTIFLRHDQSQTLLEQQKKLQRQGFYKQFPPEGTEVVSWYVMMGIGQVVTLRVPPDKLREVNRTIEESAWGAFQTEFYPTYDYIDLARENYKQLED
ncbi:hypothetical protein [Azomonas macrocytogenes]|uniref:Uncharacterized protein n=1 Tax=Azomonas macrocytogenes TaxID=69962 RepID=A0A839T6Z4_AZOMA|nr:hypothetical protein [Azomonas macrocytogenes]MBB3103725.1 hypothetical protein [Azomonas macrocytogenes]